MKHEIWRKVILFPDYEVSNFGRVRSFRRPGKCVYLKNKKFNYWRINLTDGHWLKSVSVHDLVARAFLGPKPTGYIVNHKDFNRANNCISNLEYVTPKENMYHAIVAGRTSRWRSHGHVNRHKDL